VTTLGTSHGPRQPLSWAGSCREFTRPVLKNPDDKPYNVAVLLNGNSVELCAQRKMHPYDMHNYESDRFGITELFPCSFTREDIAFTPRQITFVDSPAARMRIAILICEDSAQQHPGVDTIKQLRANMVFVPLMAGALLSDGGFGKTVKELAVNPGGIVVVANSAALAREQWTRLPAAKKEVPHPPLAIVGIPLANTSTHDSLELHKQTGPVRECVTGNSPK
jgi:predicted amidohydrolase